MGFIDNELEETKAKMKKDDEDDEDYDWSMGCIFTEKLFTDFI